MYNKFCPKLSNRIFFTNVKTNNDIEYKPCCWFNKAFSFTSKDELDQYRKELAAVESWIPECSRCKNDEEAGLVSMRKESIFKKIVKPDEISLELQLSKECNAACITCGPWSSSTWSKYNQKIQGLSTRIDIKQDFKSNIDKIIQSVDLTKVKHVTVVGGEPFMDTSHIEILSSIPDYELSSVTLEIITNGSVELTQHQKDFYKGFKQINIGFSLDGFGKTFDYHRWPLRWNQVENNFQNLMALSKENPKFKINVTTIVTPLNIFYLDQIKLWIDELEKKYSKSIYLRLAGANGVMSLGALSPKMREVLKEKYQNNELIKPFIELVPFDFKYHVNFLKHINYHDKHRQLDWKETFNEIVDYIPYKAILQGVSY